MKPTNPGERVDVLDVLRGFALFGVLWANVLWFFSGYGDLSPEQRQSIVTATFDPLALKFETFFVVNKFITIFSFLFGVGFSMQMQRAGSHGNSAKWLFARRMLWLLLFGLCHAIFVWSGDILHLYAVLGLVLLLAKVHGSRKIAVLGLFIAVLLPPLVETVVSVGQQFSDQVEQQWQAASELRTIAASGSYVDLLRSNVADFWAWLATLDVLATGLGSLGVFLIGSWVGRSAMLAIATSNDSTDSRLPSALRAVRLGLILGGLIGVVTQAIVPLITGEFWLAVLTRSILWKLGVLSLATSYVCGIVLMYRAPAWRKRLSCLAPVGRMALTNYLGQSVICVLLFFGVGLGWYGKVGPVGSLVVAIGVFATQILVSQWWLSRYRFGPAEWMWRSLTYNSRQAFRLR